MSTSRWRLQGAADQRTQKLSGGQTPQRNDHNFEGSGLSLSLYYMVGLAAFGTMVTMVSAGGRIAGERQAGWTRQLRISPLPASSYFRAKMLTATRWRYSHSPCSTAPEPRSGSAYRPGAG